MLHSRRDFDLAEEALARDGAHVGIQRLERDGTMMPQVAREVDDRRRASAGFAEDLIPVTQRLDEIRRRVGQGLGGTFESGDDADTSGAWVDPEACVGLILLSSERGR